MIMAKVTQGFCFWHKWITERDAGITQYQRCSRCGGRRILQGDTGYQPIDYGYLFKGHEEPLRLSPREAGLTEGKIKRNTKQPSEQEKPRIQPAAHPSFLENVAKVKIGGVYLPNNGSICLVTGIAIDADDTTDLVVIFKAVYSQMLFTMKLSKFVDGRFELLYSKDTERVCDAYEQVRHEIIEG